MHLLAYSQLRCSCYAKARARGTDDLSDFPCALFPFFVQARFRNIAKQIHELKQVMRDDASTAFFSLTQAAQYVAGDFRAKVRACTDSKKATARFYRF